MGFCSHVTASSSQAAILLFCLTLFAGGHNHDGHTKLGLWIITFSWDWLCSHVTASSSWTAILLTLFAGGHNHDGHTKLGLWIITGMLSFLLRWAFAAMLQPVPLRQLYYCLTLFAGGHNNDGHTKLGLWIITGMLSFFLRWGFCSHVVASSSWTAILLFNSICRRT